MDWLESAALAISLPAGCAYESAKHLGLANFTSEMLQRGCGNLDSRAFVEQLDRLGADRAASVTQAHSSFAVSVLSSSLPAIVDLIADVVRRPQLPEDQMADARLVCMQELASLEDDLFQRTMSSLRELAYPAPWGRISCGTEACVKAIELSDIRKFHADQYGPQATIVAIAGKADFSTVRDCVGNAFADWNPQTVPAIEETPSGATYRHIQHESSQTQIGLAFDSVSYADEDYFLARGAIGALSDGMSSRLFTEVRENRGLCYTVYAGCHSLKHLGRVLAYAGTSTDRAQETMDVMLSEFLRLAEGISLSELERVQARTKSSVIMQQESSAARANALAGDWFHLGRVRTVDELNALIDGLTVERINAFLKAHPPQAFRAVTLGERPLEFSHDLS